jgi:hypothetical protein
MTEFWEEYHNSIDIYENNSVNDQIYDQIYDINSIIS